MTEWRKAGESPRPMMARAAAEVQPLAQVVGDIPDVHVITVRERRVTVDYPTIIQHNVNTDAIVLDLDGEWDDMSVVLVLGPCRGATELAWHGEPLTLPSALAEDTGGIDVSVVGYSADGNTRLVTVAAPSLLNVIKSGCTVGEAPGDETPDLIGQLVAAGDAANKAAQSANAAATSASKAASAANTAASAANTAAGKANDAATKATDAATEATDAAGDATRAAQSANAAAESAGDAAEAARGNVLKGTLGPAPVLSAEDAYATKPRRLTVYGATRQNLWVNPSGTDNGVTVTSNADGSVTLSGTARSNGIWIGYKHRYILRPGSTYTLTVDKAPQEDVRFLVESRDAENAYTLIGKVYNGSLSHTFTVPDDCVFCNFLVTIHKADITVSGTYRVMLNEGSEAQPWCPPGINGVDELSIVTAGKNLLSSSTFTGVPEGILNFSLPAGTYTLSCYNAEDWWTDNPNRGNWFIHRAANNVGVAQVTMGSPLSVGSRSHATFTLPYSGDFVLRTYKTDIAEMATDLQLELGSTATAYEPPNITTTPIDLDGHTLNSLPDGTRDELRIDATGAVTLTKRVGAVTFDGSEDEAWEYTGDRIGLNGGAPGSDTIETGGANGRCDTLPVGDVASSPAIRSYNGGLVDIRNDAAITDVETGKEWLAANHTTLLYPFAAPQTIPLTAVTLPTLPSPNITVYHDSDVPSDMTVEYERDVTIAFDKLQAQVSATTVREATNG